MFPFLLKKYQYILKTFAIIAVSQLTKQVTDDVLTLNKNMCNFNKMSFFSTFNVNYIELNNNTVFYVFLCPVEKLQKSSSEPYWTFRQALYGCQAKCLTPLT